MKTITPFLSCSLFLGCAFLLQAQGIQQRPQYQSPLPGAHFVSRATTIAIRPEEILDARSTTNRSLFIVRGSASGYHAGEIVLSDDRQTLIFKPDQPFASGETVSVSFDDRLRSDNGK